MKRIIILFFTLVSISVAAQNRANSFTISGHITDIDSGETLIGAGILSESNKTIGAVTNEFGYYSLTIKREALEDLRFVFSYVGYNQQVIELKQAADTVINIALKSSEELKEAVVVARKDAGLQSMYLGSIDVPIQQIKQAPTLLGETDVLKSLQLLPGVQGGNEGFTGLFVRGGGPDENLIMLDGIPIYNVDHMLGLFSVFQAEAVKKVSLYKGSFPARYSGRVSSIVDIRTNDGNMKETHGSITLGIVSNKLHIEGPIIKDKLSYSVSGRGLMSAIYAPIIARLTDPATSANYYFYDLNGKLTWRISDRDRLYFGTYMGADVMRYRNDFNQDYQESHVQERAKFNTSWGSRIASLRWNHIFSSQLFSNATIAYNHYKMGVGTEAVEVDKHNANNSQSNFNINYNSEIRDFSARMDFDYKPNSNHIIKFGGEYVYHTYTPASFSKVNIHQDISVIQIDTTLHFQSKSSYHGHESALYVEDNFNLTENLSINPGLHFAWFHTDGSNYLSLQPRFGAKLSLGDHSIKAGYSRMAQYVHLLSSSSVSLPMDLWVPITRNIRPVTSDQFSLGFYSEALRGWELSAETYLKLTDNILEYKEGTSSIMGSNGDWENNVEMGKARSYGIELMAEKKSGKLTGWVSYTLAKSERIFPDGSINAGRWFPYKYDRRHAINIYANYSLNPYVDFNATWQYASGGTTTIAVGQSALLGREGMIHRIEDVPNRNNFRLPPSHKLSIGVNLHRKHRRGEGIWNLSIYNVYNQMNPNFVVAHTSYGDDGNLKLYLEKVTILPIIPAFSYTRTF